MRGDDKWCPENDGAYRAELAEMHRRHSTDYITPAARMAPLAALLLDRPSTNIPALAAALRAAAKKRSDPTMIADMLKECLK